MLAASTKHSGAAVAAVPLALVPALGALQGGFFPEAWVWATPLAAWAAAIGALAGGGGGLRVAWPWAAAAGALAAWTAASTLWSAHPAQSLLDARRTVLYATVVLALAVLARRRPARALVVATHAAIALLLLAALARYLLAPRRTDVFEGNLLAQPLGYANAVGILAAIGLLLGVGLAAHARPRAGRAAAAATLPPLALALALSGSRASWLALAAGGAVAALAGSSRALAAAAARASAASVAPVGLAALLRLNDIATVPSRRDGALVAAAALLGAVAAAALSVRATPVGPPVRERRLWRPVPLAAAIALAAVALGAAAGSTQPRASYWRVAWREQVAAHPLLGTGAGTFALYWARSGLEPTRAGALDAHSLYLETIAELGPIGLVLVAAMLLLPLRGARRRLEPLTPAAAGAYAAFLVHAGVDWDWEMPAVVVAALACAAALSLGDGDRLERPPPAARAAIVAVALLLGACGIAGARSSTVPAAAPQTARASQHRGPRR
ncbi:MAG: O-antigen ligase family protein, partial [Thermoleophilia bacterium]|nr:O-antigen ligase family protein [Thermoleophilia bacterium]